MRKIAILITLLMIFTLGKFAYAQNAHEVYINEIRADDSSTDNIEFIELVGPANTALTNFYIKHYNGSTSSDGGIWTHTIGTFTIPNDGVTDSGGNNIGFYVLQQKDAALSSADETYTSTTFLQNGPDGIILYDSGDNIIDAVAWQGAGDLTDDDPGTVSTSGGNTSADTYLHVTQDDDSGDNSLQAPNNVLGDDGSGWTLATATPGAINSGQTSGDISLPVELSYFSAIPKNGNVLLKWVTESEIENLGFILERNTSFPDVFEWTEIASYITHSELQGQGSVTYRTDYEFIDRDVTIGKAYDYHLSDVDFYGVKTDHPISSVTVMPPNILLHKPWPNPFNPVTQFSVFVYEESPISIKIIDTLGKEVITLVNGMVYSPGTYDFSWDGRTGSAREAGSGIYYIRFESGGEILSEKLLLIH